MRIRFHKNFEKQYKKLPTEAKNKFQERLRIFLKDEFNPILNNHALKGKHQGYRSLNVRGDFRAVYKRPSKGAAIFVVIDKHSRLYR
jgi:addiction module RelE/StbE family toxin